MEAEQIVFPFPGVRREAAAVKAPNADLVGRSYMDGASKVRVVAVNPAVPNQVTVRRELDGRSWVAPAWMIRLAVGAGKGRRAA
jgi:hypothetical protein